MGKGGGGSTEVPETAAEIALAETSAKKWQDYQENFVPLENQYMKRVDDMGTQNSINRVGNAAMGQVDQQMRGQNAGLTQQSFQHNLDPTSGGFKTKSIALNSAIDQTRQNAVNNGQFAAENSHIQGLGNIVAMGNNQETTAFNSMGSLASQAAGQAINDAQANYTKWQGDQEMKGAIAGGLASYGMDYAKNYSGDNPFKGQTLNTPAQTWEAPDTRYASQNANQPRLFGG